MTSLTVRNLTATPLAIQRVERFDPPSTEGSGGNSTAVAAGTDTSPGAEGDNNASTAPSGLASFFSAIVSVIAAILHAIGLTAGPSATVTVAEGATPSSAQDLNLALAPFQPALDTSLPAPDVERSEVIRLFIATASGHRYRVDLPSGSQRSTELEPLDGAPPAQFTAVYVPRAGFLALFSSAALDGWMGTLRDPLPLSALSLPGTHNSPACYAALPSVRCQAVGVREQLDNGVRFLDVRVSCSPDSDDLALVHSAFPVSLTGTKWFADLLAEIYAFLDAHPTEAVVMSVKREGTGKGNDQQLSRALHGRYVAADPARWLVDPAIPLLGAARGKIVLVRRFALDDSLGGQHDGRGWAIDAQAWPDNCEDGTVGSGLIRVQDFYEVTESANIEKKINYSRAQLERAAAAAAGPAMPLFVNFLTASNFFNATCWPERIAAKVNPAVIEHLCMDHAEDGRGALSLPVGDGCTGIVVTDWVGLNGDWDLIRCIVGMNARLQLAQ